MPLQERAENTRSALLLAASRVFEKKGYAATSVADILKEAGVTTGALYFHFSSKRSLAQAIIEEQAWHPVMAGNERITPLQRLIDLSYEFATSIGRDPGVRASIRLRMEQAQSGEETASSINPWFDTVRHLLTEARTRGQVASSVDIKRIAHQVAAFISGLQITSVAESGGRDLPSRFHDMWTLILPGLVSTRQISTLETPPPISGPEAPDRRAGDSD